jgi:hypothetical protein
MNLTESLARLRNTIDNLSATKEPLREAKGHMDHPEDLVLLQGSAGAQKALKAMEDTVSNPGAVTIKWDGYPALIWGYGPGGKFSVMDKHMFNKGTNSHARYIHSPQEFIQYDINRGVERTGLAELIPKIWPELQQLTPKKQGYFWGDVLFTQPLKPQKDGMYHFQANPNGIKYTVEADSPVGEKYFKDKQAGIVVHQFLDVNAENTDDTATKHSLNGTTGGLGEGKYLSILPAAMPQTPDLSLNRKLYNAAKSSISSNGPGMDEFFRDAPKPKARGDGEGESPIHGLLTMYINSKVGARNLNNLTAGFIPFVTDRAKIGRLSKSMAAELLGYTDPETNEQVPGYLQTHIAGLKDVFQVWMDIYNFKMSIVPQLDKAAESAPVQGYLQDDTKSQEGFVSHGVKFINRLGFSAQNLAGR